MARKIASSFVICCLLAAFAMPAFAGGRSVEPRRFDPATDGDLVQVTVDGLTISAWTYRNGSETDIAIQSLDKANGLSSELVLIGRDDRIDQVRPALVADETGSIYLAFVERNTGTIKLSALARGTSAWTPAQAVATGASARIAPALSLVGERIVLSFVANRAVEIRNFLPVPTSERTTYKLADGPDPVYNDLPPFPTEEDSDGQESPRTTLDNPEDFLDIDATGISDGGAG